MLTYYQTQTQQLLANPAAPVTLYAASDITGWINTARTQLAGESGCIRATGALPVTGAAQIYSFTSIANLPTGVVGVYAVRQITRTAGTGQIYMGSRGYPWAVQYWLNNPAPIPATPTEWSQYGIGEEGSLVLNNLPDTTYTLNCDSTCVPIFLADDATPEAIPYPYQDAVCYFAAYLAYLSSQRQSDADKMYGRYQEFLKRARKISVPNVLASQYDQAQEAPELPQQGGGQ